MLHLQNMYCSKAAIIVEFLSVIMLNEFVKVSFNPCGRLQEHQTHSTDVAAMFYLRGNEFFENITFFNSVLTSYVIFKAQYDKEKHTFFRINFNKLLYGPCPLRYLDWKMSNKPFLKLDVRLNIASYGNRKLGVFNNWHFQVLKY